MKRSDVLALALLWTAGATGSCGDECGDRETRCGEDCVRADLVHEYHCGACFNRCQSLERCDRGDPIDPVCICDPNFYLACDGICVDPETDTANCGECGHVCPQDSPFCRDGACSPCEHLECSGECVNPRADPENCRSCGAACAEGQACVLSTCLTPTAEDCDPPCDAVRFELCCDDGGHGECVNISIDAQNCGECGRSFGRDCCVGQDCSGG